MHIESAQSYSAPEIGRTRKSQHSTFSGAVLFILIFVVGSQPTAFGVMLRAGGQPAPQEIHGTEEPTARKWMASAQTSLTQPSSSFSLQVLFVQELMVQKAHGTCPKPVQSNLKWGCDLQTADHICCFNRHFAERSGYFLETSFLDDEKDSHPLTFYDSVTGKALFVAPRGRSWSDFVTESRAHGWPSFRDAEVVKTNVRVLENGETVSVDGTHLGHNIPDSAGNRYCINLVSVAGHPGSESKL